MDRRREMTDVVERSRGYEHDPVDEVASLLEIGALVLCESLRLAARLFSWAPSSSTSRDSLSCQPVPQKRPVSLLSPAPLPSFLFHVLGLSRNYHIN